MAEKPNMQHRPRHVASGSDASPYGVPPHGPSRLLRRLPRCLPRPRVALAIVVAATLALVVVAVATCSRPSRGTNAQAKVIAAEAAAATGTDSASSSTSGYDWSNLSTSGAGWSYADSTHTSAWGIDVSSYQGTIDWSRAKAAGVGFAIIRVGYRGYGSKGTIAEDEQFKANVEGALKAGVPVGYYFFSQATTEAEAREEAQFVLAHIAEYGSSYPVVFDMEYVTETSDRIAGLSRDELTGVAAAFCDEISSNGYYPMVYGNVGWLTQTIGLSDLQGVPVWVASYEGTPQLGHAFQMWQYSATGTVDGVDGEVDLDLAFLSR